MKRKTTLKWCFYILFLSGCTLFWGYALYISLNFAQYDIGRFDRFDWPRNLEYNELFWSDLCMASVEVQCLVSCIVHWVRILRNHPARHGGITRKAWFQRFAILTACVAVLTLIAAWRGSIYKPMIREKLDWAWVFANRYYPFVIADLFAIGAWIRWVTRGIGVHYHGIKETLIHSARANSK